MTDYELEITERVTKNEELSKSNQRRIEAVEKRQDNLDNMATSMAIMAEKQSAMGEKVDIIDSKVTAIEQKPAEKWETVVSEVLKLFIAAIIGFCLSRIGL